MQSGKRGAAHSMLLAAERVSTPQMRDWVRAMRSELDHVEEAEAFGFALGCLTAVLRASLFSDWGLSRLSRLAIVAGPLGFAATCLGVGATRGALNGPTWVLLGIAAFYALVSGLAWVGKLSALRGVLALALGLSGAVVAGFTLNNGLPWALGYQSFYFAVAVEQVGFLAFTFLAVGLAAHWRRRARHEWEASR